MGEQRRGVVVELVVVEQKTERALRLAADEDVLRHGQVVHQLQFLMNDADAGLLRLARVGGIHAGAVVADLAGILTVDAGENLHQRGLARAVLAHQRVDLAGHQIEPSAGERAHAGGRLADVLGFNEQHGAPRRRSRRGTLDVTPAPPRAERRASPPRCIDRSDRETERGPAAPRTATDWSRHGDLEWRCRRVVPCAPPLDRTRSCWLIYLTNDFY